jgi:two-component system chemotaxis response regulator CheB
MNIESDEPLMNPGQEPTGAIVPWACPECSGTLWETVSDPVAQFRCRVGHAYSEDSFLKEHRTTIERTLWAAVRLLEERAAALRHLAGHASKNHEADRATELEVDAAESCGCAWDVRRAIETCTRESKGNGDGRATAAERR